MSEVKFQIGDKTFQTEEEYLSYIMSMDTDEYFKIRKNKGRKITFSIKAFTSDTYNKINKL